VSKSCNSPPAIYVHGLLNFPYPLEIKVFHPLAQPISTLAGDGAFFAPTASFNEAAKVVTVCNLSTATGGAFVKGARFPKTPFQHHFRASIPPDLWLPRPSGANFTDEFSRPIPHRPLVLLFAWSEAQIKAFFFRELSYFIFNRNRRDFGASCVPSLSTTNMISFRILSGRCFFFRESPKNPDCAF